MVSQNPDHVMQKNIRVEISQQKTMVIASYANIPVIRQNRNQNKSIN